MDGLTIRNAGSIVNTGISPTSREMNSVSQSGNPDGPISIGGSGSAYNVSLSGGINGPSSVGAASPSGALGNTIGINGADQTGKSFTESLKEAVNQVNTLQKESDHKMQELATGKSQNIHETMIAAEKADIALRLMVQVRNKVIEAYQEIMRMQV